MRIAEINMMHIGSTGKIMFGIADTAIERGNEVYTFSPYYYRKGEKIETVDIQNHSFFGSLRETIIHLAFAEITGLNGCGSVFGTKQLVRKLKKIEPDIIHLHNLHNSTINIPILFKYIKKEKPHVVWTLHDCWAMTGKCPHFEAINCEKWEKGCYRCPVIHEYPKAYVDQVRLMWKLKRKWFTGIENLTIVTPSKWLAKIVQKSYLADYPVRVINNGIDLNVFKPIDSDIRDRLGVSLKRYIILGVSFDWDEKKGIDVFVKLSNILPDEYQIVLVGINDKIKEKMPSNIMCIHRTQNQRELAELYSTADVFVNPTREDTFPTVNIEALACGTPVITFNTGGCPEIIDDSCGISVERDNIPQMVESIKTVCEHNLFLPEACVTRARHYDKHNCYMHYVDLYNAMVEQ